MEPAQRDDEIFDVVDAGDRVIGQATRREVHAQEFYHRAIHILIFNKAGQVFLQKRSVAKDTHPGCWDSSVSGHLDSGEDYSTAAVRECREELGVGPPELKKLFKLAPTKGNGWEFVEVYQGIDPGPFKLNSAEISEGRWFSRAEIDHLILNVPETCAQSFIEVWQHLETHS